MLASMVLITLAAAPIGMIARRPPRRLIGWGMALFPLALFALFSAQIPLITEGERIVEIIPWVPAFGLELAFTLDGLSLLFALVITGIGTLIFGYAGHYMDSDAGLGRLYVYLFLFMGAMLGVVLAGNVLTMFVFWELTSVTSYLLIGYKHDYPDSRRGALQSLLVTGFGGLALLVGLLLLGSAAQAAGFSGAEAYRFDSILAASDTIKQNVLYTPAMILVFLGAFTKSAQFPFHFWLPSAMQAPTPVSAFLHSATMVKAGIYLLARLNPGMGDTALWSGTLVAFGGFTFAMGAIIAFRQYDIKALLAYSTISMLGAIVMQIGLGGKYGAEGVTINILAHALYKSALFMIAGIIDHETGTRDLNKLGGLRRYMPRTMVLTAIALLSLGGIPIMFGFVAKEVLLAAAVESPLDPFWRYGALTATMIAAVGFLIAGWRLFSNAFLGDAHPEVQQQHIGDPSLGMLVSPGIPTFLSLVLPLGLLPFVSELIAPASFAVYGNTFEVELKLWHGVNLPLILSLSAIATGVILARFEQTFSTFRSPLPRWANGSMLFDQLTNGMLATATSMTRSIQSGRLRTYVLYTALAFLGFVGVPFVLFGLGDIRPGLAGDVQFYEVITVALIPIGVIATITANTRLGAIIAVGMVGAMVALSFVLYSAPDLALTQLLIEVLSTVFLLLVFSVLPARFESLSSAWVRIRDAVLAVGVGVLMTGLVLAAATSDAFAPISPFFLENSLSEGKGANVVNVILVDFRGFDTLGEVVVLFVAMLGIYGLLRMRQKQVPSALKGTMNDRILSSETSEVPVPTSLPSQHDDQPGQSYSAQN
jgi:multicomponent Na+:H+ antiporter subunit A